MSGRVTTFNPSVMSRWGCPIKAAAKIVLFPAGNTSKTSRFDPETARDDITDPGNTIPRRPNDQSAPGQHESRGRNSVFPAAFNPNSELRNSVLAQSRQVAKGYDTPGPACFITPFGI